MEGEKPAVKLEWMYGGTESSVNKEEYLLGKRVDKAHFDSSKSAETTSAGAASTQGNVGATFDLSSVSLNLDRQNKDREDPLSSIRKREEQSKRELLMNPVKMKQLENKLRSLESSKKHKNKKSSKSRHRSGSEVEDSLDALLTKKLKKSLKAGDVSQTVLKSIKPGGYGLVKKILEPETGSASKREGRHQHGQDRTSRSPPKQVGGRRSRSRSRSPHRGGRHRPTSSDDHRSKRWARGGSPPHHRHHARSPEPRGREGSGALAGKAKKRKMGEAELEKKRMEMMENAKWRDQQRKQRVTKYQAEENAELEMEKKKSANAEFLEPLKLPSNISVEGRIKSKVHSLQRTQAALDKNFTKR